MTDRRAVDATPIAVVGIGCRFPGGVIDADSFWRLLVGNTDAISEVPQSRFDLGRYFDARAATPGRTMSRWGGFVEPIDRFDAAFFGISPREAETVDPQQRLLLEVAWEALEDAGQDLHRLRSHRTSVFVGQWLSDFESRLFADAEDVDFAMTTGSGRYASSGRISYALGLDGPSLTIDTACSSSLVAVHLAVQSLRSGESEAALAGGVNLILQPQISIAYSQSRMMAPDGRCKFGDAAGDGYVRSEGAALVLLKPLARALHDGDRVYAVIRGSAVNNDGGRSGSLGTPSRPGQELLLRAAYRDAGCNPGRVTYVEAHGTGTRAGDPVELGALTTVLADGRSPGERAWVGSVKTNIGHTEGAAGVAGLVKVALSLQRNCIPASLHCRTPNPAVDWAALPLDLPRSNLEWDTQGRPRLAGVSAFGIAGTNAHVVLEQAPNVDKRGPVADGDEPSLLLLSARSPEALGDLASRYAEHLGTSEAPLRDLCWSAAMRRTALEHRAAFVAGDRPGLIESLRRHAAGHDAGECGAVYEESPTRVVFVCPGQGGQWLGMARDLLRTEPVFREALERCDAAAQPHLGLSIIAVLEERADAPLERIDVVQPVLVALSIAYAALLRHGGIEPDAVVGHSMGEVAAAHVAGVLDLDQAMQIVCQRSALMREVSGRGAMALVDLPAAQMALRLRGLEDRVSIAVVNSPRSCVVSGDVAAVDDLLLQLEREQVFCRPVRVDVASHSVQMEPLALRLREQLGALRPAAAALPWYSTVRAAPMTGFDADASYWHDNLRQPVRFGDTIGRLIADGHHVFIELGPHPVLRPSIEQQAESAGQSVVALGCANRHEADAVAWRRTLGQLWAVGARPAWERVLREGRYVDLPLYPWQRVRHWGPAAQRQPGMAAPTETSRDGRPRHPLLQRRFDAAGDGPRAATQWETTVSGHRQRLYGDHRLSGIALWPAAATCEVVLAAARDARPELEWTLQAIELPTAVPLGDDGPTLLQGRIDWTDERSGHFELRAQPHGIGPWVLHATGSLCAASDAPLDDPARIAMPADPEEPVHDDAHSFYQRMNDIGLDYGGAFRAVASSDLGAVSGEATLCVPPEAADADAPSYIAYPPLLDGALQVLLAMLLPPGVATPHVPVSIGRVVLKGRLEAGHTLRARAVASQPPPARALRGSVQVEDSAGRVIATVSDVEFHASAGSPASMANQLHSVQWMRCETTDRGGVQARAVLLVAGSSTDAQPLADALARRTVATTVHVSSTLDAGALASALQALQRASGGERVDVAYLGALAGSPRGDDPTWLESAWHGAVDGVATLTRAVAEAGLVQPPRVWLVSRRAMRVEPDRTGDLGDIDIGQAALWGIGRVLTHEQAQLDVRLIDIDESSTAVVDELLADAPRERQLARRGGHWFVPRLEPLAVQRPDDRSPSATPASWRAALGRPAALDTLHWQQAQRSAPGPGEVEVEVEATAVNFINVMSALGIYPGRENGVGPLGIECAGRVTRVGAGVSTVALGDDVIALGPECLGRHALIDQALVRRRPAGWAAVDAAAVGIAFCTAWHSLAELARLQPGESVLIHSAAGGVGLAAIQVARLLGARVLVTAGTDGKRAWLRSTGVEHVFDSRDTAFADQTLEATAGRGVDVVLNSLSGAAIAAGLRALAPHGRFIELGKRDIYGGTTLALAPFRKSLSFFAVDLDAMMREQPQRLGRVLAAVVDRLNDGQLHRLPVRRYAADSLAEAFADLMPGTHVGKHVVDLASTPTSVAPADGSRCTVRADGTYLISGGLGALGLRLAHWLAQRGAGRIVLLGRRAADDATLARLRALEAGGTRIVVERCDVAREPELAAVMARLRRDGPPLRGVFHAAGVLADATIMHIEAEPSRAVRDPKVLGAWHLDRLSAGDPLDHFVLLSSVASLFGTPGQGSYAAANAVLDALAHDRRARGLPALSINLGPIGGEGLAAASRVRQRALGRLGFDSLDASHAVDAIDRLLASGTTQAACMRWRPAQWLAATRREGAIGLVQPAPAQPPTAGAQATADGAPVVTFGDQLAATPVGQPRRALVESTLREEIGRVLKMSAERVPVDRPLKALGLDSLMALELRGRLERRTGLALSPTLAWNHPTVRALGEHLAERLGVTLEAATTAADSGANEVDALVEQLSALDDGELQRLLTEDAGDRA